MWRFLGQLVVQAIISDLDTSIPLTPGYLTTFVPTPLTATIPIPIPLVVLAIATWASAWLRRFIFPQMNVSMRTHRATRLQLTLAYWVMLPSLLYALFSLLPSLAHSLAWTKQGPNLKEAGF
jgi:hypothetical protein